MITIEMVAGDFVKFLKKKRLFDGKAIDSLILGGGDYSFVCQDGFDVGMDISDSDAADSIEMAIIESIKKYTRSKSTAIFVYKEFIKYISSQYNMVIPLDVPDWLPSTSLERQLQIVKILHDPDVDVAKLSDLLLVSTRTIEEDLKRIRNNSQGADCDVDSDYLEVMGQRLSVDLSRRKGRVSFDSTVHPLFLTFNLTQVITTLEGLRKMAAEDSAYNNYAMNAAKTIWLQLSDYAKKRIFTVSEGLGLDVSWYNSLESGLKNAFYSEMMCSHSYRCGGILDCLKNGKPCYIDYLGDDGKNIYYKNCLIKSYRSENMMIEVDGEIIALKPDRVVKAALTVNEIF